MRTNLKNRCLRSFRPIVALLEERSLLSSLSLTVTTLADDQISPIHGQTTLRDAITQADARTTNQYVITFAVNGTIDLTKALPDLKNNITLEGPGASKLIVKRNSSAAAFSVFTVDSGETVRLFGMTIAGGNSINGGGIYNDGTLTVTSSIFISNSATDGWGGGICNDGTVTVNNSIFTHNSATDGDGGGIYNDGTLTVTSSTFTDNSVTDGDGGGGIDNDGTLTVTDSIFISNTATDGGGGGICNDGTLTVTDSIFISNTATDGGGGIYNDGTLTVTDSIFISNSATDGWGGGICNDGTVTVKYSIFTQNSATDGAGIASDGTVTVKYSIFANNSATDGGGINCLNMSTLINANNSFCYNSGGNVDVYASGCFAAGTLVATEHGLRRIEEINSGDNVYAYDHEARKWILANVIEPLTHTYSGDVITIVVGGDKIKATGNHPFWVASGDHLDTRPVAKDVPIHEQGTTNNGRWVEARDLRVGDTLLRNNEKTVKVDNVDLYKDHMSVHNLEISMIHNYSVGSIGVLVHNKV